MCVSACPTHALALENVNEKGSTTAVLIHDRTICEGTARCIELCPEGAISRGDTLSLAEMKRVEVARVQTAKCRKCQSLFEDDGEDLCPTCRRVEQDPFGSWLPPGFERK
ncbi:4Fe-4S dicluster domain-containing protein [Actinomyces sp.]|uniref:4Fe-4S dicluster domain-containing protein n=1 Tax=Actinomyces sp. TaxID=29317 RepID=UPI0037BF062D